MENFNCDFCRTLARVETECWPNTGTQIAKQPYGKTDLAKECNAHLGELPVHA